MKCAAKITLAFVFLGLVGCSTFSAKTVLESKKPFEGLRLEIGSEKEGRAPARILVAEFPGAVFEGQAEKTPSGGWKVSLTTLRWFNNWANGWTDASFLLEGVLAFEKGPAGWLVNVDTVPSIAVADKASLRYFDSYLLGDQALEQFSRRWERVQAATAFLATKFPESWIDNREKVERFLFPELRGYEKGETPGTTTVVDSLLWDVTYSASHFEEALRPVRDSGTMFRDWQESPGLWVLSFHWAPYWKRAVSVVLIEKK